MTMIYARVGFAISFAFLILANFGIVTSSEKATDPGSFSKTKRNPPNTILNPNAGPELARLDLQYSRCGINQIDIRELTIGQAKSLFRLKRLSATELTLCYITRIKAMNPYLQAVIQINEDAVPAAMKADLEILLGKNTGSVLGIPILISDEIGTVDMMQTTFGAVALENVKPIRDSTIVMNLKRAGAIILGKTNVAEWGGHRDPGIPDSWSARGGQSRNPYKLSADPLSNTGTAAAPAANLCMGVVGIQTTSGSGTVAPASQCSTVGFKGSLGAVSLDGCVILSFSQDTVGVTARTFTDVALVATALRKLIHCEDPSTCLVIKSFVVGVPRVPFFNPNDPLVGPALGLFNAAFATLTGTGRASVIDVVGNAANYNNVTATAQTIVIAHETKYNTDLYLLSETQHFEGLLGRSIRSLKDIIKFNTDHPDGYGQADLVLAEASGSKLNKTYQTSRDSNAGNAQAYIAGLIYGNNLDMLASPCIQGASGFSLPQIASIAGFPTVTVPIGDVDGVPVGICFTGVAHSVPYLLKIGYILEQAALLRTPPTFQN